MSKGTPLLGDRATVDIAIKEKHASDLQDGAPRLVHLPDPGTPGNIVIDDGEKWTSGSIPGGGPLDDHDHSGDTGDGGAFDAANLSSGASSDGQVLTSDGSGGTSWETPSGTGSGMTDPTSEVGDLIIKYGSFSYDAANGATATANNSYDVNTPDKSVDGNDATWWNCNSGGLSSWLKIDLGSSLPIFQFRLKQYTPYYAPSWKLQSSDDDITYVDVLTKTGDTGDIAKTYIDSVDHTIYTARYWKLIPLTLNYSSYWDIFTIELWTSPDLYITRLPIGNEGDILKVVDGIPTWVAP